MLQRQSYGSVETIALDRVRAIDGLRLMAKNLRKAYPEVAEVRLFGSIARGDQVGTSDADILILLSGEQNFDPLEKARQFIPFFEAPIGVDLLILQAGETRRRIMDHDPYLTQIWSESLLLA